MVKFFVNRELSELLGIRLSKWKRWSREFLPPDPLGGLRSGYARQYTADQAFTVFLGGHLVADMHYSMPEAKQIITDLSPWFDERAQPAGFYDNGSKKMPSQHGNRDTMVFIYRCLPPDPSDLCFLYVERTCLADESFEKGGAHVRRETYREKVISTASGPASGHTVDNLKKIDGSILYVTQLHHRFIERLSGGQRHQDTGKMEGQKIRR